jgi:predicted 3-demethylubiquinone-9 3-methyltransferase (glyoxalase superfamily)
MSLFVECESEADLDQVFGRVATGGIVLMPVADYGFSTKLGWVKGRFGLSGS